VVSDSVAIMSVADAGPVDSGGGITVDVSGSSDDHVTDETIGIIDTGATAQHNCTLCAGAITQEVDYIVCLDMLAALHFLFVCIFKDYVEMWIQIKHLMSNDLKVMGHFTEQFLTINSIYSHCTE